MSQTELQELKEIFIKWRNYILDSWWKPYFPFYRNWLKEIDEKIDLISLELYKPYQEKTDKLLKEAQQTIDKWNEGNV